MTHASIIGLCKPISLLLVFLGIQLGAKQEVTKAQDSVPRHFSQAVPVKSSQAERSKLAPGAICPGQLGRAIDGITNRPYFHRSRWGILIQTLSPLGNRDSTLYAANAQRYFLPASNTKLLTTAAALHRLGPQFHIRTSVYGVRFGAKLAALRLQGRGDPSFTDDQLKVLAQQLSRQGIRQVDQLVGSDDYFHGPTINPRWEVEDIQADYGAPVNSLILNQNAVELMLLPQAIGQPLRVAWGDPAEARNWRIQNSAIAVEATRSNSVTVSRDLGQPMIQITGQLPIGSKPEPIAVAIPDPAQHFLRHFRQALIAQQISVNQVQIVPSLGAVGEHALAAVDSPPLGQLLVKINQESNNLYAESLLRTLGVSIGESLGVDLGNPLDTNQSETLMDSAENGLAVVTKTLTDLGIDPESYVMADGSGLSRHNLVSPEALVQTLRAMMKSPEAAVYRASLPVAGVSGTLQSRFRNTPAQGILRAKTGSLSGMSALSGYLNSPNFPPLVFSILVNQSEQSGTVLRQAIDEIALLLTRLRSC